MGDELEFRPLEVTLKQAVRLCMRLRGARSAKRKALAEYNLGLASGIIKTLDLLGYGVWKEGVLRQLDREFPSPFESWFGLLPDRTYLPDRG